MELDKENISQKTKDNLDEEDLNIEDKYDDFKELEKDLNSNNIAIKVVGIVFLIILLIFKCVNSLSKAFEQYIKYISAEFLKPLRRLQKQFFSQ